jgi:lipopolysaccharide biosynthesis glycosyltransferase
VSSFVFPLSYAIWNVQVRWLVRRRLPNADVYTIDATAELDEVAFDQLRDSALSHVSRITMFRLFLPALFPCLNKMLWLDLDLLVLAPLRPLWETQLTRGRGKCGMMARDSPVQEQNVDWFVGTDLPESTYLLFEAGRHAFNAGVLLMDLDYLRRPSRSLQSFVMHVLQNTTGYGINDQTILNLFCRGLHEKLAPKWNAMSNHRGDVDADFMMGQNNATRAAILHFASTPKPWDAHPRGAVLRRQTRPREAHRERFRLFTETYHGALTQLS